MVGLTAFRVRPATIIAEARCGIRKGLTEIHEGDRSIEIGEMTETIDVRRASGDGRHHPAIESGMAGAYHDRIVVDAVCGAEGGEADDLGIAVQRHLGTQAVEFGQAEGLGLVDRLISEDDAHDLAFLPSVSRTSLRK